jgi:hypothetical protein
MRLRHPTPEFRHGPSAKSTRTTTHTSHSVVSLLISQCWHTLCVLLCPQEKITPSLNTLSPNMAAQEILVDAILFDMVEQSTSPSSK